MTLQDLNRRDLFKFAAAAAFTARQLPAFDPNAPLFFTSDQFALLDTLTELIIPADDHSPGARSAGVAAYIDRAVAEAFVAEEKNSWRRGLAAIDQLSMSRFNTSFSRASHSQQVSLLNELAQTEKHPQSEPEKFFTQLKETTAFAYYSSSVGIHDDINYKGNVILDKFVGYEAT
jgi:hypothetical protein